MILEIMSDNAVNLFHSLNIILNIQNGSIVASVSPISTHFCYFYIFIASSLVSKVHVFIVLFLFEEIPLDTK